MKLLFLIALGTFCAYGQALSVSTLNYGSQAPIRQEVLISAPPQVWAIITDTTGSDAYAVTLSYNKADGTQYSSTITQLAAHPGSPGTVVVFYLDAFAIDSITVLPLKFTGALYKQ